MSNNFWQTRRQIGQLRNGNTISERVTIYTKTWEDRCYKNGIPDEVPGRLLQSGRAPCWKAVALALLRNDHKLHALGFSQTPSKTATMLAENIKARESKQLDLFENIQ